MAILAAVAALAMSPVSAATVEGKFEGPVFSPDSVGTVTEGETQWNFGVAIRDQRGGQRFLDRNPGMNGGHSLVNLIGSDACDSVGVAQRCLVGTIRYTNRVNVGAGSGVLDTATARFTGTQYNFNIAFNIAIDRSTNDSCAGNQFGCSDQWFVNFTSPMSDFIIEGSGGMVEEESFADINIFWIRPGTNPDVDDPVDPEDPDVPVVPLPASALFLGAGVAGLAALRRRKARA